MRNKILILGKGFIGERIREEIGGDISDKILHSYSEADKEIKRFSPDILINCIGITGKRSVDDCESVKDDTLLANSFVPLMAAEVALRRGMRFVHISSGCIYQYDYKKDNAITEEKLPDYFDLFYSRTKIYSEQALAVLSKKYPFLIARIRIPLDNRPNPKNILNKLIRYKLAIDIPNSVTYIPDFIGALKHLLKIKASGIYNIVNNGVLRYPDLLDVYKKYNPSFKYSKVSLKSLGLKRTNIILSARKLENCGFRMRDIGRVLDECVRGYMEYKQ